VKVSFNDEQEFLNELKRDYATQHIRDEAVRLTVKTSTSNQVPITSVFVLAAYFNFNDVVELEKYCGQSMHGIPSEKDGLAKAREVVARLQSEMENVGLVVRPGRFILDNDK